MFGWFVDLDNTTQKIWMWSDWSIFKKGAKVKSDHVDKLEEEKFKSKREFAESSILEQKHGNDEKLKSGKCWESAKQSENQQLISMRI